MYITNSNASQTVKSYVPGSPTVPKEIPLVWELSRDYKYCPVSKGGDRESYPCALSLIGMSH